MSFRTGLSFFSSKWQTRSLETCLKTISFNSNITIQKLILPQNGTTLCWGLENGRDKTQESDWQPLEHFGFLGYIGVSLSCMYSLTLKILFILSPFMWPPPRSLTVPPLDGCRINVSDFIPPLSFQDHHVHLPNPYASFSPKITAKKTERQRTYNVFLTEMVFKYFRLCIKESLTIMSRWFLIYNVAGSGALRALCLVR